MMLKKMDKEEIEKRKQSYKELSKMTPEEKKKIREEKLAKMSPEERVWNEWEYASSIWNFNVGRNSRNGGHDLEYHNDKKIIKSNRKIYEKTIFAGKLVPHLVKKLILKYSEPNELVVDFFSGTGTIALECKHNSRKCIAIDINPQSIELTKEKLSHLPNSKKTKKNNIKIIEGDSEKVDFIKDLSVDLILTHPPYWGLIQYTENVNDLSNMSIEQFLIKIKKIFKQAFRILKDEKFFIIVIGDGRKIGHVPLSSYLELMGLELGFNLWDVLIYDTRFGGKQYDPYRQMRSKRHKFHLTDHDFILIFQKRKQGWNYLKMDSIMKD